MKDEPGLDICEHGYPFKERCRECDDYHADQMRAERKDERNE